jgi:hypothetical protein
MRARVLDCDGSIVAQDRLLESLDPNLHDLRTWGPLLRRRCSGRVFEGFEQSLFAQLDGPPGPWLTFLGSSDFHHLGLALLRRRETPFNLLVLDDRAEWASGGTSIDCDNWLRHALAYPQVQRVFHAGGNSGFDDARRLAPRRALEEGRIVLFPAIRTFHGGWWQRVPHEPLRANAFRRCDLERLEGMLTPYREELLRWPLYVSLDKKVLVLRDAAVNGPSGCLWLEEMLDVVQMFSRLSDENLVGIDIAGDWSAAACTGMMQRWRSRWSASRDEVDPVQARLINERTNLRIVNRLLTLQEAAPAPLRLAA